MLNKGLELIEAQHLFLVPADKLKVLIHPQSIIHGLITMYDGSVMAHMGTPDMQIPIAYCLGWPERLKANIASLDLAAEGELSFLAPDFKRYPCLELAYEALNAGQGTQTVMNAANEIAVEAFRNGEISFTYIASLIHDTMDQMTDADISSLSDVYAVDEAARRKALDIISLKK
jgi:1-deoxy-D-xylulose-5-phosphate reductoisomerase